MLFDPINPVDPVSGRLQWNRNIAREKASDEFSNVFGREKVERIGEKEFSYLRGSEEVPSQETLDKMTKFHNEHYFGPQTVDESTQRVVYITFAANVHVILKRLNENNSDLSKHTVLCLDVDDYITEPPKEWDTYSRSTTGYRKYAELTKTFFDFSLLKLKEPETASSSSYPS